MGTRESHEINGPRAEKQRYVTNEESFGGNNGANARRITLNIELRGGEVVPDVATGLHLEDSALIRMEEVSSTGNPVIGRRFYGAARPMCRTDSSAMLLDLGNEVDTIFHTVLDTGRPGGY
jgi:hypothetical protein